MALLFYAQGGAFYDAAKHSINLQGGTIAG